MEPEREKAEAFLKELSEVCAKHSLSLKCEIDEDGFPTNFINVDDTIFLYGKLTPVYDHNDLTEGD